MPLVLLLLGALAAAVHALVDPSARDEAPTADRSVGSSRAPSGESAAPQRRAPARRPAKESQPRIAESSPFHSRAACEAYLKRRPARPRRGPRIGTWNVRWFPYGDSARKPGPQSTDVAFLACAIAALDVDVLAVQEFVQDPRGRGALLDLIARLDQLTGGRYRAELDDCPGTGFQHLGFIFDTRRVTVTGARPLSAFNPGRSACEHGLRPGFGLYARFEAGPDLHLLNLHLDSGITPRDYAHRALLGDALARVQPGLERAERDRDLLVLGDFNSMGCSDCDPQVSAGEELAHQDAQLASQALARVPLPSDRGCSHYYRSEPGLLDHVLARSGMEELPEGARVEVQGPCGELACKKVPHSAAAAYWDSLSDHCPLVVELLPEDRDGAR